MIRGLLDYQEENRYALEQAWSSFQKPTVKFSGILEVIVNDGHFFKSKIVEIYN